MKIVYVKDKEPLDKADKKNSKKEQMQINAKQWILRQKAKNHKMALKMIARMEELRNNDL